VLNALRHQRFRHATRFRSIPGLIKCSTPYGIKGFGTRCNVSYSQATPVLNALRHQRFRHALPILSAFSIPCAQRLTASKVSAHAVMCSYSQATPVLNALRHQRFRHALPILSAFSIPCAQRLTASKVSARHTLDLRLGKAPNATLQAGNDRTTISRHTKPKVIKFTIQNDLSSTILAPCKHDCSLLNSAKAIHQSLSASESQSYHFTDSPPCTLIRS
jgi:hypothetical protein